MAKKSLNDKLTEADILEYRVGRLELHRGDVLVVKLERDSSMEEINRIAQMFGGFIGPSCRLLIIPPGIDLTIMTREEIDARATKGADAPPPRLTPPL